MTATRARRVPLSAVCLSAALVLSGCAASAAGPGSPSTSQVAGDLLSAEEATESVYETTAVIAARGSGDWLLDHPVGLRVIDIDGRSKLSVDGPCNTLTYDLQYAGLQTSVRLVTGGPATTSVGCLDAAGEREQWLRDVLGAGDVSLTQTTTTMRIRSGPVTIDATAKATPTSTETQAAPASPRDPQPSPLPTEAPPCPPTADTAYGPMIDLQQLTNPALDLADGAGSRLSTLSVEEKKQYPIYAVRATSAELSSCAPGLGGDTRISPEAPMWALSVHAPVVNDAPYGFPAKEWDVYTVVYDGDTGEAIVSSTGVDLQALGMRGEVITAR
ncbi:hypothetical protein EDF35_2240 [Rathayibacter sp. PhB151]|uniref:hypothetical protein n=1 Tax=Rathayibacter sp. PhB151 TaxID=2485189 RepID=UPI001062A823|nr:hypothetical protein [Rathayibacter sp. PhB151]TDX79015.1 hypothetical protein EDF35_2240 [Rathayibacter sp. PhB151]